MNNLRPWLAALILLPFLAACNIAKTVLQTAASGPGAVSTSTNISMGYPYLGIIMSNGECFDLDSRQMAAAPDAACDLWLVAPTLFRQMNGAKLSAYVTLAPPTRSQCANSRYEPGDVALQTDLFFCFISNKGRVGYVLVHYLGDVPNPGIVFDYLLFE